MIVKPPDSKRLQGAADVRRRVRRRTAVLQVPGNAAGVVPCERLRLHNCKSRSTLCKKNRYKKEGKKGADTVFYGPGPGNKKKPAK